MPTKNAIVVITYCPQCDGTDGLLIDYPGRYTCTECKHQDTYSPNPRPNEEPTLIDGKNLASELHGLIDWMVSLDHTAVGTYQDHDGNYGITVNESAE